jgi:hypothetical protein
MTGESLMDESGPSPSRPNENMGEGDEQHNEGPAVLINSEIYPDAQPGDVIKLHVVKNHGQELEVTFAGKEGDEMERPSEGGDEMEPEPKGESLMD